MIEDFSVILSVADGVNTLYPQGWPAKGMLPWFSVHFLTDIGVFVFTPRLSIHEILLNQKREIHINGRFIRYSVRPGTINENYHSNW